jgi:hypothetical protein
MHAGLMNSTRIAADVGLGLGQLNGGSSLKTLLYASSCLDLYVSRHVTLRRRQCSSTHSSTAMPITIVNSSFRNLFCPLENRRFYCQQVPPLDL